MKTRNKDDAGVIADRFLALRRRCRMTQKAVAVAAGIDATTPSKIEGGTNVLNSWPLLSSLAQAFGVPAKALDAYFDEVIDLDKLMMYRRIVSAGVRRKSNRYSSS